MPESKGVCIWLTGRGGAGKSTVAGALASLLAQHGRIVSMLDVVPCLEKRWFERTSEGKLIRKAFVAAAVVQHGGVAICVTISARQETRRAVRKLIGASNFVEVFVDTPSDVCLTRRAARGRKPSASKRFKTAYRRVLAGVPFWRRSSYQPPLSPEITLNGHGQPPGESARTIFQYLVDRGFVVPEDVQGYSLGEPAGGELQTVPESRI